MRDINERATTAFAIGAFAGFLACGIVITALEVGQGLATDVRWVDRKHKIVRYRSEWYALKQVERNYKYVSPATGKEFK